MVRLVLPAARRSRSRTARTTPRPNASCAASGKEPAQARVVGGRLLGDGVHHRHQLARAARRTARAPRRPSCRSRRRRSADRRCARRARRSRRTGGSDRASVSSSGRIGGKVVGRARPRPGVVGGGACALSARDEFGRHLDRPARTRAARRGSGWRRPNRRAALGVGHSRRAAGRARGRWPSRAPAGEQRALPAARCRAARRHVGRLIPAQHARPPSRDR